MARTSKSGSIKIMATQRADDYKWEIPESPEFLGGTWHASCSFGSR